MRTKYHDLKEKILNIEEWVWNKDEKESVIKIIDGLYEEYVERHQSENKKGKYGLKYYTIHDDSSYYDEHKVWFKTKEEREQIYDKWGGTQSWDTLFDDDYMYPRPGMNYNHSKTVKIDKETVEVEVEKQI